MTKYGGEWRTPFDEAAAAMDKKSRTVPEEIMSYYICERLGIHWAELMAMPIASVYGELAYLYGRDVAQGGRENGR